MVLYCNRYCSLFLYSHYLHVSCILIYFSYLEMPEMSWKCECLCKTISFDLYCCPIEIVNCYCSIVQFDVVYKTQTQTQTQTHIICHLQSVINV